MSATPPPSPSGQYTPPPQQFPYTVVTPGPTPAVPAEKPTAAMVLSIIGGVFILLGGLAEIAVGSVISSLTLGVGGGVVIGLGALGLVLGILILVFGILVHSHPEQHTLYGVLIVVFSIVSLVSFVGGFVIGFILALIGGILALTFKPTPVAVFYAAPPVQRVCPKCGRVVDPGVRFCSQCGNPLP